MEVILDHEPSGCMRRVPVDPMVAAAARQLIHCHFVVVDSLWEWQRVMARRIDSAFEEVP